AHRIQEITRPVKIGFGSISLRSDQDNGFLGIGCEVEPIRCLLKRVGSMRNDDAGYFLSGECTVDFAGQSDPPRRIHVVGRDVLKNALGLLSMLVSCRQVRRGSFMAIPLGNVYGKTA